MLNKCKIFKISKKRSKKIKNKINYLRIKKKRKIQRIKNNEKKSKFYVTL